MVNSGKGCVFSMRWTRGFYFLRHGNRPEYFLDCDIQTRLIPSGRHALNTRYIGDDKLAANLYRESRQPNLCSIRGLPERSGQLNGLFSTFIVDKLS